VRGVALSPNVHEEEENVSLMHKVPLTYHFQWVLFPSLPLFTRLRNRLVIRESTTKAPLISQSTSPPLCRDLSLTSFFLSGNMLALRVNPRGGRRRSRGTLLPPLLANEARPLFRSATPPLHLLFLSLRALTSPTTTPRPRQFPLSLRQRKAREELERRALRTTIREWH